MKRTTLASVLAASVVGLAAGWSAWGSDDPHSSTFKVGCDITAGNQFCHAPHTAAGTNALLATSGGNANLCQSCHTTTGLASRFPMQTMLPANVVSDTGSSHSWNAASTNANAGASVPLNTNMAVRLDPANTGNVICSTCHDQHTNLDAAITAGTAGTQWTGTVTHAQGSGTGTVSFAYSGTANPKGYLIEIAEVGGAVGTAKFRFSNDGGTSWWGWSGSAWVAYAVGNARLTSTTAIALNDGTNASVAFTGAVAGSFVLSPTPDRFRSYVSYAFLRAPLDQGAYVAGTANNFCRDCHRTWAMNHTSVETYDGTMKQHPTGIVLNANGGGYDRAANAILDGDGSVQPGDGNAFNNLKLAPDNTIQCYTCHGMHHAPANTTASFAP